MFQEVSETECDSHELYEYDRLINELKESPKVLEWHEMWHYSVCLLLVIVNGWTELTPAVICH